jgi:hypothetical protein
MRPTYQYQKRLPRTRGGRFLFIVFVVFGLIVTAGLSYYYSISARQVKKPNSDQTTQTKTVSLPTTFSELLRSNQIHTSITTTVFWVGEKATTDNANIANNMSVWDEKWQEQYGGIDTPNSRNGYYPASFTPKENPFYFALPYSDFNTNGSRKNTATNCPLVDTTKNKSWCKNGWIKITFGQKFAYAQWEDAGPLGEDDVQYVFGTGQPKNTFNNHAGLDVSPAVRDYLSLPDIAKTDWEFVDAASVPPGPWRTIRTVSMGTVTAQ